MNEEEKQALEILKGLEFEEYDWYVKTDKIEGHANDVVEKVEKALQIILNLVEKQQKQIKILKDNLVEERAFCKSTLETLKNCVDKDYLHKMISFKDGEIEKLKEDYQILKDDIEGHRIVYVDTPEFEEKYISKDKIKEKIEELKNRKIGASTGIYAIQVDILEELLGE